MRCTPYGYCMCRQEPTCSYPDCRVGDMLAGNDDSQPSLEMAVAVPPPDDIPVIRGTVVGLLVSAMLVVAGWAWWRLVQWWLA